MAQARESDLGSRRRLRSHPLAGNLGVFTFILWLAFAGAAPAQEFGKIFWGFTGNAVVGRFNMVTVEVRNPTDQPIDKHLRMRRTNLAGAPVGAFLEQRCYLAAGSRKTLRFYPFVETSFCRWRFSWREGGAAEKVSSSLTRPPGIVFLETEPELNKKTILRTIPPEILPTTAVAMDTLAAIVLDRIPELTQPQRRALLDWVRGGGILYQLPYRGSYQVFQDELQVLNVVAAEGELVYGSGRVVRREEPRAALATKLPKPFLLGYQLNPVSVESPLGYARDLLRGKVETDHNWPLIFLLTVIYLGAIGPLFYRLALNGLQWYVGLLGLTGVIAVATWLFMMIGERGMGEQDVVNAFSYARSLGDGRFDVTTYNDVFVTNGGDRKVVGTSPFDLFTTGQSKERVRGVVGNGPRATYELDFPRFSHRMVVQKRQVTLSPEPKIRFALTKISRADRIHTDLEVESITEVVGKSLWTWHKQSNGVWSRSSKYSIAKWMERSLYSEDKLEFCYHKLIGNRLHLSQRDPREPLTPLGRHEFFVLVAEHPDAFRLTGDVPENQSGHAVYHFDVVDSE